jgi:hypothetical protein
MVPWIVNFQVKFRVYTLATINANNVSAPLRYIRLTVYP